jgi:hypothetical protein
MEVAAVLQVREVIVLCLLVSAPGLALGADSYQQADAKLNALYGQLKSLSTPEAWKQWVAEERAWLKRRDETCGAGVRPDNQDCLTRLTNERVGSFEKQIAELAKQVTTTFAGGWTAWHCPPKVTEDPEKCSNFTIFLYQRQGQLCGVHAYATVNASRVDEGVAPSILGKVTGPEADGVVQSGRADPPVRLRVQLSLVKDRLHWKTVGLEGNDGDYLIPDDVWLSRERDAALAKDADLEAACQKPVPSFN